MYVAVNSKLNFNEIRVIDDYNYCLSHEAATVTIDLYIDSLISKIESWNQAS